MESLQRTVARATFAAFVLIAAAAGVAGEQAERAAEQIIRAVVCILQDQGSAPAPEPDPCA